MIAMITPAKIKIGISTFCAISIKKSLISEPSETLFVIPIYCILLERPTSLSADSIVSSKILSKTLQKFTPCAIEKALIPWMMRKQ